MTTLLRKWLPGQEAVRLFVTGWLGRHVPRSSRLTHMTGSMLVSAFSFQLLTGLCLWTVYSPSSQTAWESVFFIQHEVTFGWLVRGMHHFMAQAMMILLALHFLVVVYTGKYRPPKSFSYWSGMALLFLVLAMGFTGYLLVWDQRGRAASGVATNLMAATPMVGEYVQTMAIGGQDFGHATLTRFLALHAGLIPALIVLLVGVHGVVTAAARTRMARERAEARNEEIERHQERQAAAERRGDTSTARIEAAQAEDAANVHPDDLFRPWWPNQAVWDFFGGTAVLLIVFLITIHFDFGAFFRSDTPLTHLGAELGAPADPSVPFDAARPEWYFLFLFQFLKLWESEFIGAILIPGLVATVLFLFPITGAWRIGHIFNCAFLTMLLAGMLFLTSWALVLDANDNGYQAAVRTAHIRFERARDLYGRREGDSPQAGPGMIPRSGAAAMLRDDPLLRGPELFARNCASCHPYYDPADPFTLGTERDPRFPLAVDLKLAIDRVENGDDVIDAAEPLPGVSLSAPNLWRFGSRQWLDGLLDPQRIDHADLAINESQVKTANNPTASVTGESTTTSVVGAAVDAPYFGNTRLREGRMSAWVKQHIRRTGSGDPAADASTDAATGDTASDGVLDETQVADIVAALSAQAKLPYQREQDAADAERISRGNLLIRSTCATWCHRYGDAGSLGLGPDLTGYASYEWMMGMVGDPSHVRFYRNENDRMPSFAESATDPTRNQLTVMEVSMIVDWIRGEYYRTNDPSPVLSHSASEAAQAHQAALKSDDPPAVLGAEVDPAIAARQRAEALFRVNCASCHSHVDAFGQGIVAKDVSAPNLHGFASRDWTAGILDPKQIATPKYFGRTAHADGEMVSWVESNLTDLSEEDAEALRKVVIALSAEAALPGQADADQQATDDGVIEEGRALLVEQFSCTDCHAFGDDGDTGSGAPTLTGWGSAEWLKRFIAAPDADEFYGFNNDRMPRFRRAGAHAELSILTEDELDLIVRLLRGDSFEDLASP